MTTSGVFQRSQSSSKVCSEPKPNNNLIRIIYYLCHKGQLQHPHFMEVTLSSPSSGLYLKDVFKRLDYLRGKGFANSYTWSVKRSYKNGFVWQDLAENDIIVPTHGHEYILKASELIPYARSSSQKDFDLNEYKVYKADIKVAEAATQTEELSNYQNVEALRAEELESEEISPPPSSSSPETVESLVKPDGHIGVVELFDRERSTIGRGRMRASSVLMQLISCGSVNVKNPNGFSPARQLSRRLSSRGVFDGSVSMDRRGFSGLSRLEDKEYFSGSLIETRKKKSNGISGVIGDNEDGFGVFKRSSSYNVDMVSKLNLGDKEVNNAGAKCMPRKANKTMPIKEYANDAAISRNSSLGSSRRMNKDSQQL